MMEVKIAPGHTVGEFGSSDDPSGTDSAEKPGWLSYYPQLKPLLIPNVRPTGKELGRWAWGPVEELEIGGFTCAGKRFVGAALARACVLASELHHPNIVQFLGVCTLPDSQLPVAVTEVLWKSLRDFFNPQKLHLPQFPGQFPYHMRLYILADIAKGLLYLHTRNPPIIHRYINPVTIMLSSNMVAKITSFRHATKLDQAQSHYELEALDYVGWRWSYAPPEGGDNPETGLRKLRCVPNFDIYSYGAVALFVLTQDYFPWKMRTEVVWHQRHLDILQEQLGEQHPIVQLVTKCLSHDPALRPSADELIRQLELELKNQVPSEDQHYLVSMKNKRDAQQLFTEAMEKGYVLCRMAVLLLVGAAGAGKSHVKQLLLGLPPPDLRQSTPLVESPIRAISMSRAIVSSTGKVWRVVFSEELDEMIASCIKVRQRSTDGTCRPSLQLPIEEVISVATPTSSSNDEGTPTPLGTSASIDPTVSIGTDSHRDDLANQLALSDLESELVDLVSKSSGSRKLFDVDWVYLLDTGGQPQFQELLAAFLHRALTFVYVTKLSESLSHLPMVDYYDSEGRKCGTSYASPLTNLQILLHYLQVMQSRCHDQREGPSVFIVGTHKDLESTSDQSETRAEKNEKLASILRPRFGRKLGYYRIAEEEEIIFPLNAKQPGPEDQDVAEQLRNVVGDMSRDTPVRIPFPWYVFEQFLRKLAAKKGVNILSLRECQQVAEWLSMGPDACHAALVFLAKLNVLFYDPEHLPGVVFVSSQVLLSIVTALVYLVHVLRGEKSDKSVDLQLSRSVNWIDFRDYGLLTLELLASKRFEGHYRDGVFSPCDLITLLKGRQIVAQINESKFVMPCLLPEISPSESECHRRLDLSSPAFPLLVEYPDRWLPAGVFTLLVAYLQNEAMWKLTLLKGGKPVCFRRRCVEFSLPTRQPGTVVLVDSLEYLEVHAQSRFPDVIQAACPEIVRSVFRGLERAAEILKYDNLKPRKAFFCLQKDAECEDTLHLATVAGDMWTCGTNPKVGGKLEQRHLLWLDGTGPPKSPTSYQGQSISSANVPLPCLGDKPTMRHLQCLRSRGGRVVKPIESIAFRWDEVAIALDIDWCVIKYIRTDAHFQAVPACLEMLHKWLDGEGCQPATWMRFMEALIDAGFTNLAEDLEEVLKS